MQNPAAIEQTIQLRGGHYVELETCDCRSPFLMVTDLQSNFAVAQEYTDPLPVPAQQVIVPVKTR